MFRRNGYNSHMDILSESERIAKEMRVALQNNEQRLNAVEQSHSQIKHRLAELVHALVPHRKEECHDAS